MGGDLNEAGRLRQVNGRVSDLDNVSVNRGNADPDVDERFSPWTGRWCSPRDYAGNVVGFSSFPLVQFLRGYTASPVSSRKPSG